MNEKTTKKMQTAEQTQAPEQQAAEQIRHAEELVAPGRFGVTNSQLIPAIKQAIADGDMERLAMLKERYLYTFTNSLRYLKKSERQYITDKLM